ncbi:MAG: DUF932 domain-containing protein [Gemmatimonas sp.]|nr:DUF932 domain-containing protein [Gemmatimonas sp.]
MPAELAYTNGTADFFEVGTRRSAWHREGHLIPRECEITIPGALELIHGDYGVVRRPTLYPVDLAGDELRQSQHAYVTIRTDTGKELGSVGRNYTVLQNEAAFRALEPLVDQGIVRLETGGVLRSGADIWMLGRFDIERFGPVVREVFADEVVPYCLFSNNHSGRRNACVALTPIRVVCANTLGVAERRGDQGVDRLIKVSHTGDAATKMVDAATTLLAGLIERFEAVATQYRRLKATYVPEAAFAKLVLDEVAPDPRNRPDFNPEARTAELVLNRAERKRAELRRLWDEGAGHTGDHSAWEAYNAAAEAIDHNAELWPNRTGAYRTASLMDGNLLRLKQNVLVNLSRYAPEIPA